MTYLLTGYELIFLGLLGLLFVGVAVFFYRQAIKERTLRLEIYEKIADFLGKTEIFLDIGQELINEGFFLNKELAKKEFKGYRTGVKDMFYTLSKEKT